jgi:Protein of unknown function (DUF2865)
MNLYPRRHDQWAGTGLGTLFSIPDTHHQAGACATRIGAHKGDEAVLVTSRNNLRLRARLALLAAVTVAAMAATVSSASAQGFFDQLFGRRSVGPSASAFADPFQWFGSRPAEAPRPEMSGGGGFCVRLCDGRFFPITRSANVSPAQSCSSFCPATATKVYHGGSIEHAVGADGKRYAELSTAFAFREKIVEGCTCNGKDAFGLVTPPVDGDATLQPGDIVATNNGLMAYNGNYGRGHAASFTPIASYSGVSAELRRKLTETKIEPAAAAPAPPPVKPVDTTATVRSGKNKRAQVER